LVIFRQFSAKKLPFKKMFDPVFHTLTVFCMYNREKSFGCFDPIFALKNSILNTHTVIVPRNLFGSCPPATEKTGAMGREIESHQGIGW
jgi:hypothetical protein